MTKKPIAMKKKLLPDPTPLGEATIPFEKSCFCYKPIVTISAFDIDKYNCVIVQKPNWKCPFFIFRHNIKFKEEVFGPSVT